MAPSRAPTSPGSDQNADDSVNVRFDDGFDDDVGADWGGGQLDDGEGDVTMEVYDGAGGAEDGFSEGEGGVGSPVVPLEDEEDEEEEERVVVEKRRTSKGKRPRVDDDSEEEEEGYVHHHHEAQNDDGDEQMDDHQPAVYSDPDNDEAGRSPPLVDRTDASDEEAVQKPTKGKGRPKKAKQVEVDSGEEGEKRPIGAREKGKGRAYQPRVALQPSTFPLHPSILSPPLEVSWPLLTCWTCPLSPGSTRDRPPARLRPNVRL